MTLDVEGRRTRTARLPEVVAAVESLTPDGGPGFLIVSGPGEDYAQVAGGLGRYTVEWRSYSGTTFEHWKAGRAGVPTDGVERVPTNGFHVDVQGHEVLARDDVVAILTAYLEGRPRPDGYVWRAMAFPSPDGPTPADTIQ